MHGHTKVKSIFFTFYEAVFPLTQHTINFIYAVFMTVVFLIKDCIINLFVFVITSGLACYYQTDVTLFNLKGTQYNTLKNNQIFRLIIVNRLVLQ